MLMGNTVEHHHRVGCTRVNQLRGEGGHRCRQCFLLGALFLITSVEQVGEQLRVRGEHLGVKDAGDGFDIFPDQRQRGPDGFAVFRT